MHRPVGAIAEVVESIDEDGRIFAELAACGVAAEDGSDVIRASVVGPVDQAVRLGKDPPPNCWSWEPRSSSAPVRGTDPRRDVDTAGSPDVPAPADTVDSHAGDSAVTAALNGQGRRVRTHEPCSEQRHTGEQGRTGATGPDTFRGFGSR